MACVEAALQAGDVAALLIDGRANEELTESVVGMVSMAQSMDVAVLIAEDALLAKSAGADGVQIAADVGTLESARALLGDDPIIGVAAGHSRHAAMELAEAGASYVTFDEAANDPESLSAWWAHVMEVPCVAHVAASVEAVMQAVETGVEFVSPDETMWASPEAAAEAVSQYNAAIAGASAV